MLLVCFGADRPSDRLSPEQWLTGLLAVRVKLHAAAATHEEGQPRQIIVGQLVEISAAVDVVRGHLRQPDEIDEVLARHQRHVTRAQRRNRRTHGPGMRNEGRQPSAFGRRNHRCAFHTNVQLGHVSHATSMAFSTRQPLKCSRIVMCAICLA